jgi:hypothetical protein
MSDKPGEGVKIETEDGLVLTTEDGQAITTEPKVGEAKVGTAKLGFDTSGGLDTDGGVG